MNVKEVISTIERCRQCQCDYCKIEDASGYPWDCIAYERLIDSAINLLKEQQKENKALRLLVEWAEECDFGFDNFQDEYERYKGEIEDMGYIDGMIHVAKRTLEDNEEFGGV